MDHFSRRRFLTAACVGAGAALGARIPGRSLLGTAWAGTPEPTSVVCIFLNGGINAIFTGADAFSTSGAFGVTGSNTTNLGGVVVDKTLADAIPQSLHPHVATIGVRHGISDHSVAQRSLFVVGSQSAPLALAHAIGGDGAIKAAAVGSDALPRGQRPAPVGGVSLQPITDMKATIEAIAGAPNAPDRADRAGTARGIAAAQAMSKDVLAKHPSSLASVDQGLTSAIATLSKPVQPFDVTEFNGAYTLKGTSVNTFAARMAAAELMVRSGTNFLIAEDGGGLWDTHGDMGGTSARNMMRQRIAPALNVFLSRVVAANSPQRNVVVAIFGDFHRSLPFSDHQAGLAALVIGKGIKNATTGKTNDKVGLPAGTPSIPGLWQFLAAAAKVDVNPFGANPHAVLA